MNGKQFTDQLDQLGYFSYTPQDTLDEAKRSLARCFDEGNVFMVGTSHEPPFLSFDGRFYNCGDGEGLYEAGGVPDMLEEMRPVFEKAGFKLDYSNDEYTQTGHTIIVNSKAYVMAAGSILMWGETFLKYAEMINEELKLQGIDEQLYLLDYDDSSYMVFLTEEQGDFLRETLPDGSRPLKTAEWMRRTIQKMNDLMN
ncbi:MAG TPA: hypothetical protein VGS79_02265 [Puia sp.]|nr:hypothetical protein [Puia sp.]